MLIHISMSIIIIIIIIAIISLMYAAGEAGGASQIVRLQV